MRRQLGSRRKPRRAREGAAFSLRLVVVVGFGVEIVLVADLAGAADADLIAQIVAYALACHRANQALVPHFRL
ncbi:hypothetical protein CN243_34180 [Sinorhizobium meliloti]|nr:hypothetical protein CN243_34180 [Sinorhizobium meliloti]